jgi:hypothetical protein
VGGGLAGIIGLIAPGDPFAGGDGGDRPIDIPGFIVSLDTGDTLRAGLEEGTVIVAFDPANGSPLVGHMVGSSSRGPSIALNQVKPEIGAPGGSISAIAGTGTEEGPFSGTSGAAPMVSGSAALLMQAYPDRNWAEIKAVLVNNGETNILNKSLVFGGGLAPITRIGGGEVRVDRALDSDLAAWERNTLASTLSWGFRDITNRATQVKRVVVRNYSDDDLELMTVTEFRFGDDASGEVTLSAPESFTVPAGESVTIPVRLFIRPSEDAPLHPWVMNSGSEGANGDALTFNEYDGYLHFVEVGNESNSIHLPWQVLPRPAGNIRIGVAEDGSAWLRNRGIADTFIDTYSLIGVSDDQPNPDPGSNAAPADFRYIGVQTFPVPAGFCSDVDSFVMGFAVNTWDRQTHLNTTAFDFFLDTNSDGTPDYEVFNFDASFTGLSDGRNVTWVADLTTGLATGFFFTQHFTNSANTLLLFCGEQIGMNAEDFFVTSINIDAFAIDLFGAGFDEVLGMNVVPLGERFFTVFENGDIQLTVLPPRSDRLGFDIIDFGEQLNETETGVLWLYGPGAPAHNEAVAIELLP